MAQLCDYFRTYGEQLKPFICDTGSWLRKAAQDRISMFGYGLFACLYVSYPPMNEIWEYSGANVCVCGGYLLDAAALNLLWDARQPGVPWRGRALRARNCAAGCGPKPFYSVTAAPTRARAGLC